MPSLVATIGLLLRNSPYAASFLSSSSSRAPASFFDKLNCVFADALIRFLQESFITINHGFHDCLAII